MFVGRHLVLAFLNSHGSMSPSIDLSDLSLLVSSSYLTAIRGYIYIYTCMLGSWNHE